MTFVIGDFVKHDQHGIGRLESVDSKWAEVDFFISPVGPTFELLRLKVDQLQPIPEIPDQTRIYWLDPVSDSWRVARVDGGRIAASVLGVSEDHYQVRFPNSEDRRVPLSEVQIRWAHPIEDPTHLVAARTTETPFFGNLRSQIQTFLAGQRSAMGGLVGLSTAAIEYCAHQLAIVRRVLSDPVRRYILADEVGLGKTIEAGILIKQHLAELASEAFVVVVAPPHLVGQWQEELEAKFSVEDESKIEFVSVENLKWPLQSEENKLPTLLVVDEAHGPCSWAFSDSEEHLRRFSILREMALTAPEVLLLSGTPVLNQEDGFLAMLHLIDPEGYSLEDRTAFQTRVRNRQVVADALTDLEEDSASLFIEDAIEALEAAFPEDASLVGLCENVRRKLDDGLETNQAIKDLRIHIAESYRLHRRLLRTRRDHPRVACLLPKREGLQWLNVEDPGRLAVEGFLEDWQERVGGSILNEKPELPLALFASFVEGSLSHPRVLCRLLRTRLGYLRGQIEASGAEDNPLAIAPVFSGEADQIAGWVERVDSVNDFEPRVEALAEHLQRQTRIRKAIVFVDDSEVADRVARALCRHLGEESVSRHDENDRQSVNVFVRGGASVLVCDRRGEEGLNLQEQNAWVVFYDQPLSAPRIEQRLGRVDRIEGRSKLHLIGFCATGPYEKAWVSYLNDTVGVYNRSVSALQYVLAESTKRLQQTLIFGPTAITKEQAFLEREQGGLDWELSRIRSQEALDALEWDDAEEEAFVDQVQQAAEEAVNNGRRAFDSWLNKALNFASRGDDPFHFVHSVSDRGPRTLLPLSETHERFLEFLDYDASRYHKLALGPFTFDPEVADDTENIHLLRVGHPFWEQVVKLLEDDDRGKAWILWRSSREFNLKAPEVFFGFSMVVEPDIAGACEVLGWETPVARDALSRRADSVFPTIYRRLWVCQDNQILEDPIRKQWLERPYRGGGANVRDENVRMGRWEIVNSALPLSDWEEICIAARETAEQNLRNMDVFVSACEKAAETLKRDAERSESVIENWILRMSGRAQDHEKQLLERERAVTEALISAVTKPLLRVDSAGAVFLAPQPLEVSF